MLAVRQAVRVLCSPNINGCNDSVHADVCFKLHPKRPYICIQSSGSAEPVPMCVPKTLSELPTGWNRLSWRDDRAPAFRSGHCDFVVQVEEPA
jgi:hypothetical protein